jgi:hypothetical protein
MADIAAANVTVTVLKRYSYTDKQKRTVVQITFGNGTLTYPAGGVPLPAKGVFGMTQSLDFLVLIQKASADGLIYKYDYANKKIRIWNPTQQTAGAGNRAGVELASGTDAPAATTIVAEAVGF